MILFYGVVFILMVLLLLSELENRKLEAINAFLERDMLELQRDAELERNARARRKKASQPLVKQRKKK